MPPWPGRSVQPAIDGNLFRFTAADLFDVRGVKGGEVCCARSTATLSLGTRKLWTAHLNEWRGKTTSVQHVVTRAGWYNFDVSAARWNPHGSEPAGLSVAASHNPSGTSTSARWRRPVSR